MNDVIFEIDGKITSLQQELASFRKDFEAFRQETRDSISEIKNETRTAISSIRSEYRVINERVNSLDARLSTMQYTLNFAVSVGGLLLVALPLMWGLRRLFAFSIKDEIRRAVSAELDSRNP